MDPRKPKQIKSVWFSGLDTCLPAGRVHLTVDNVFFVYIIQSQKDSRLYKGLTRNLDRRIKEHNTGKTKSTKSYKPWKIVYFEEFQNLEEARNRERFFKSGEGRELLKNILDP